MKGMLALGSLLNELSDMLRFLARALNLFLMPGAQHPHESFVMCLTSLPGEAAT